MFRIASGIYQREVRPSGQISPKDLYLDGLVTSEVDQGVLSSVGALEVRPTLSISR